MQLLENVKNFITYLTTKYFPQKFLIHPSRDYTQNQTPDNRRKGCLDAIIKRRDITTIRNLPLTRPEQVAMSKFRQFPFFTAQEKLIQEPDLQVSPQKTKPIRVRSQCHPKFL